MKQPKLMKWIIVFVCFFFLYGSEVSAKMKKWEERFIYSKKDTSSNKFDIEAFGIRYNSPNENSNQISLSHLYQNAPDQSVRNWNVNTLKTTLYTKFNRFDILVDQGILNTATQYGIPTQTVYRLGFNMQQAYLDNDAMYFGMYVGTGRPYAELSFYGGYSRNFNHVGKVLGEVNAMIFGEDKTYFSFAVSIFKKISNHHLTLKPYYSKTLHDKLNLILSDQIYFKNNINSLTLKLVTGYYPDYNLFINYTHINDQRYRVSSEGSFEIPKYKITLLPLIGCDNVKDYREDFAFSWIFQFSLRYTFKHKEYYAQNWK